MSSRSTGRPRYPITSYRQIVDGERVVGAARIAGPNQIEVGVEPRGLDVSTAAGRATYVELLAALVEFAEQELARLRA